MSLKVFYICLLSSIFIVIALIAMGFEDKLFAASSEVIHAYKAGPENTTKKQVSGVKTNFSWSKEGNCNCDDESGAPCIQTFLDKRVDQPAPRYPSMIEDYYIQNNMGDLYQGAGQVPWGIDASSVRLINIPFCGQSRRANAPTK